MAATKGNWNEVRNAFDRRRGEQTAGVAGAANEDDAQGLLVGVAAE